MPIKRLFGDESPIRMTWDLKGHTDMSAVTGIELRVYDTKAIEGSTLIETLNGEIRGFDPATYFPVINGDWDGTRYVRVVLFKGTEEMPLPMVDTWVQN